MKNLVSTCILLLCIHLSGISQSVINEYSFIVVPEQFGFQSSEDQYQLNSMTKFYFNKYGCNAFFMKELPDVSNCDGLWADVEYHDRFSVNRMTVKLRDCKGEEVYSFTGDRNKYKEYKKAYQASLRAAFDEIKLFNLNQPDPVIKTIEQSKEIASTSEVASIKPIAPSNKYNAYVYNNTSYILKQIEGGYSIYEESSSSDSGLLLKGSILKEGDTYTGVLFEKIYSGAFLNNKDLLLSTKEGTTITLKFQN
jgi:hypothetical protein